jgi:hypothetical protein
MWEDPMEGSHIIREVPLEGSHKLYSYLVEAITLSLPSSAYQWKYHDIKWC